MISILAREWVGPGPPVRLSRERDESLPEVSERNLTQPSGSRGARKGEKGERKGDEERNGEVVFACFSGNELSMRPARTQSERRSRAA